MTIHLQLEDIDKARNELTAALFNLLSNGQFQPNGIDEALRANACQLVLNSFEKICKKTEVKFK